MNTMDNIQELSFPYSIEGVHVGIAACHSGTGQKINVVTAKLHRNRAILIAAPVEADIPPVEDWGVHLMEHLADILGVRTEFIFRVPIFYRNRTGLLDALMLQHTLSEDGSIKRSVVPISLEYCDAHSVEQQVEELLPHFGKACKQALQRALLS